MGRARDVISIQGLRVDCIVGVYPHERDRVQPLEIDVRLVLDTRRAGESERHYVVVSKTLTAFWGLLAIGFAMAATLAENLIEAINILGSLFYGTILGIFLTAFLLKRVGGTAVFTAALVAEGTVITLYLTSDIGYLWYNLIGCAVCIVLSLALQAILPSRAPVAGGRGT